MRLFFYGFGKGYDELKVRHGWKELEKEVEGKIGIEYGWNDEPCDWI